jgi:hypothetical protein
MVRLRSQLTGLSQITWNGYMRRSACLEAARHFCLRELRRQEVQSASPTRQRRAS